MNKAIYDKSVPTRNLISTISGIVTLLITVLVGFGVIKPENSVDVQAHAASIINAVVVIIGAVTGLLQILKMKDA